MVYAHMLLCFFLQLQNGVRRGMCAESPDHARARSSNAHIILHPIEHAAR